MLAADLRPSDAHEIIAAAGPDTLGTIRSAISSSSHVTVAEHGGRLVSIFGLAPVSLVSGIGSPWMLGTPALANLRCPLARIARRYIAEGLAIYPVLSNWVDDRNTESIKLLSWIGFDIGEPEPYGVARLPFRKFEMRRT